MTKELLDCNPSSGSYGAEPYSASEIDQLDNADRVWATIVSLRELAAREANIERDIVDGDIEGQFEDTLDDCNDAADKAIEFIKDSLAAMERLKDIVS